MDDMNISKKELRSKKAIRVTYIGSIVNIILTIFKFAAGILGGSRAMLADAVHSLSDFITDIVVIASFVVSKQPEDKGHDYGHGKFETLAAAFVGILLLAVGAGLIFSGSKTVFLYFQGGELTRPGWIALAAAAVSILFKELLFYYTKYQAEKIDSSVLLANAWHHRSDSLSSIGTLAGISGAFFLGAKWKILDPIAAIVVSFFILKAAWEILYSSVNELLEASLCEKTEIEILDLIKSVDGVSLPHRLRTRKIGDTIAIDVHIMVDPDLTVYEGHKISTDVEKRLENKYGSECFISIHIEPLPKE